jgi:hypothetical protein
LLGDADFAWLDGLRQRHFPPERNYLRAHLTLFHHLPPSAEAEIAGLLCDLTRAPAPKAQISGLINLGRGVAYRIESPELVDIRTMIAEHFAPLLTPQDKAGWRPHVTVQNKVDPARSRALLLKLEDGFAAQGVEIAGLALWHYLGGPWQSAGAWRFGNGHAMKPPGPLGG